MQYRIIVETKANGVENFYVQKKIFGFLWVYFREIRDISMYKYRILFSNIEDAKLAIQYHRNNIDRHKNQKVIKRSILNQQ